MLSYYCLKCVKLVILRPLYLMFPRSSCRTIHSQKYHYIYNGIYRHFEY